MLLKDILLYLRERNCPVLTFHILYHFISYFIYFTLILCVLFFPFHLGEQPTYSQIVSEIEVQAHVASCTSPLLTETHVSTGPSLPTDH